MDGKVKAKGEKEKRVNAATVIAGAGGRFCCGHFGDGIPELRNLRTAIGKAKMIILLERRKV